MRFDGQMAQPGPSMGQTVELFRARRSSMHREHLEDGELERDTPVAQDARLQRKGERPLDRRYDAALDGRCDREMLMSMPAVTLGLLEDLIQELRVKGILFSISDEQLGRHLVSKLTADAWTLSTDAVRELLRTSLALEGPLDKNDFFRWLRKSVFQLERLPGDCLAEIHAWASEDLAAIEANLAVCDEQERKLGEELNDGDGPRRRFYRYFARMNQQARSEIVSVLAHSMHDKALERVWARPKHSMWMTEPVWQYRWDPTRYDPHEFSPLPHAFRMHPIGRIAEWQNTWDADKTKFDEQLRGYFQQVQPVSTVRRMLAEHHLLAARDGVLGRALDAFGRGEWELFASAVVVQIEGPIEDACILSGIPWDRLRAGTLVPKLDALLEDNPAALDYVYYAFEFPVLRNRLAHGRAVDGDMERTANLLLLDLRDACMVVRHHQGAANAQVELLQRVGAHASFSDIFEFAVLHCELEGRGPDPFYNLGAPFDFMRASLQSAHLWACVHELGRPERLQNPAMPEGLGGGLRWLALRLKPMWPALKNECRKILRDWREEAYSTRDRVHFVWRVRALLDAIEQNDQRSRLISALRERDLHFRIREQAYFLWLAAGRPQGMELEHWHRARTCVAERFVAMAGW